MAHQVIDVVTPYISTPGAVNPALLAAATANAAALVDNTVAALALPAQVHQEVVEQVTSSPTVIDAATAAVAAAFTAAAPADVLAAVSGAAFYRGQLSAGSSADVLRLRADVGVWSVYDTATAETITGLPVAAPGTLTVAWVRGSGATSSVAMQEYRTVSGAAYTREASSSGWTPWERTSWTRGQLSAGSSVDVLRLAEDVGVWSVYDAATAAAITGLPRPWSGALTVWWVRGGSLSTSVAMQEYRTTDGEVYTRQTSGAGWTPWAAPGSASITRVDIFLAAGQSNMSGRGTPYGADLDPPHPRIWEVGAHAPTLRVASVPLDMRGDNPNAALSIATTFAREWVARTGETTVALLVPAAQGGTGFDSGTWNWRDPDGPWSLTAAMLTQTATAIAAAQAKWPGATVTVRGMLWHQGENSSGLDQPGYTAAIDDLFARVRAGLGAPDLPIILGELSPDRREGAPERVSDLTIADTPARVARTAVAHSRAGLSRDGDLSHYGREGVTLLGQRMADAYTAAVANAAGVLAMPPGFVQAWRDGTSVRVEWSAPLCRATGYQVATYDGTNWTTAGDDLTVIGRRATITGARATTTTHVRIATLTPSGTSRPTPQIPVGAHSA
ncbi:sialate O-acetylesterase [Xylanimonas ulmi]|uniref:Carbohydrate esterase-like sialic acid-specific acetylesterase n=1 Tax=Xylanimonas ulmi TaxID=228973 RepID=A0A4Q7M1J0_9MICO|nr:sialate O-acetylesterase [Xylanibacterium ulmi]RZS61695.1 carbohydrate esterase-like sialic acid-specific acetylesterase [Xylanibacterium ulmi]